MDPNILSAIMVIVAAVVGWFLRHKGIGAPAGAPPPVVPASPLSAKQVLLGAGEDLAGLLIKGLGQHFDQQQVAADRNAALSGGLSKLVASAPVPPPTP